MLCTRTIGASINSVFVIGAFRYKGRTVAAITGVRFSVGFGPQVISKVVLGLKMAPTFLAAVVATFVMIIESTLALQYLVAPAAIGMTVCRAIMMDEFIFIVKVGITIGAVMMARAAFVMLDEVALVQIIFITILADVVRAGVADMLQVRRLMRETAFTAFTIYHLVSSGQPL